jgi:hypothetical protein
MDVDDRLSLPPPLLMGRRGLLTCGAAAAFWPATAIAASPGAQTGCPATDALTFQVSRNGAPIGTHKLTFSRAGDDLTVHIDAAFRVGFGFITVYRYRHVGVERWRGGRFDLLETTTNDNGRMLRVQARRTPDGVAIKATGVPDQTAPADALPLTHWAMAAMTAPLFNPETGKMLRETARPRGAGMIDLANGTSIRATAFSLMGEAPIEDWYDDTRVWAALDAVGQDGSKITYRRG